MHSISTANYFSDPHSWVQVLYIIANGLIWSAYITIPLLIAHYVRKKKAPFNKLYILFAIFIFVCSTIFLTDVLLVWYPLYKLTTILRLATGLLSWVATIAFIKVLPYAFSMRTAGEFEREINRRKKIEQELTEQNRRLKNAEKIANMFYVHWDVKNDKVELSDEGYPRLGMDTDKHNTLKDFMNLLHEEDKLHVQDVIGKMLRDKAFYEFSFRTKQQEDHIQKHFAIKGEVHTDEEGNIDKLVGSIQDVTEQQQHINLIRTHLKRLDEIAWIQNHLVRGPVTTIIGLTQLIHPDEPQHPDNKKTLQGIIEACRKLDNATRNIDEHTKPERY